MLKVAFICVHNACRSQIAEALGKKLASDTQSRGFSGVCLIDLATGEEDMPIQAATTWQHPCHPHPQYNFGGDRLTFHEAYEGNCAVGVLALDGIRVLPWN